MEQDDKAKRLHVSIFEPETLLMSVLMAALGAIICMQLISKLGITPNTSVIGLVIAMAVARIPVGPFKKFRSLDRQNLVQTMISASGFGAANCVLLSVGIFWVLGRTDLIVPMAIGSLLGILGDLYLVYKTFDTPLFPANGSWPPGKSVAETMLAGDEGGARGRRLLQGVAIGVLGSVFKLPVAGFGIPFIANMLPMGALGVGLILRGYSQQLLKMNMGASYIPHGLMIGGGIVSLIQAVIIVMKGYKKKKEQVSTPSDPQHEPQSAEPAQDIPTSPAVSATEIPKAFVRAGLLFLIGALVLALISGIFSSMSVGQIIVWIAWSTFSALISTILVGMCAMQSGWFPGFAITVIFLTIGVFMKIPMIPLALLTGFTTSTGPVLADLGYDLTTGWIIRGKGKDQTYELAGRREQLKTDIIGAFVATAVVLLTMNMHFKMDLLPPVSRVFAATVQAGADPTIVKDLVTWAIPGAILQAIGGASNTLGVLLATGLLIQNPTYGIGILAGIAVRLVVGNKWAEGRVQGALAGDGLYSFVAAVIRAFTGT